jgi:hypothetical protein
MKQSVLIVDMRFCHMQKNGAFIKAWKTDNTGLAELHKCLVQN